MSNVLIIACTLVALNAYAANARYVCAYHHRETSTTHPFTIKCVDGKIEIKRVESSPVAHLVVENTGIPWHGDPLFLDKSKIKLKVTGTNSVFDTTYIGDALDFLRLKQVFENPDKIGVMLGGASVPCGGSLATSMGAELYSPITISFLTGGTHGRFYFNTFGKGQFGVPPDKKSPLNGQEYVEQNNSFLDCVREN